MTGSRSASCIEGVFEGGLLRKSVARLKVERRATGSTRGESVMTAPRISWIPKGPVTPGKKVGWRLINNDRVPVVTVFTPSVREKYYAGEGAGMYVLVLYVYTSNPHSTSAPQCSQPSSFGGCGSSIFSGRADLFCP